jgi:hypothetical protein
MTDEFPMIPPELFAPRMEPNGWLRPIDRLVDGYLRKIAERDEQDAIKRFRRNLTTVDPWRVPRPDTSWDCVYGTLEEQYPGVAEVARKNLDKAQPVPPAARNSPGIPVWTFGGQDYFPGDVAQCADLWGFLDDKPLWGLAPGDYAITPLEHGLQARQVTPGNGWGHVAIVEAGPEYVEPDYVDGDDGFDDDLEDDAYDQEIHLFVQIGNALNRHFPGQPEFTLVNRNEWPEMINARYSPSQAVDAPEYLL